jgi:hypothetical protein
MASRCARFVTNSRAAIGFRAHAGWAAAVCLRGPVSSPRVVERRRLRLTDAPMPYEPYHQASVLDPGRAGKLIEDASIEADTRALLCMEEMLRTAAHLDCDSTSVGVLMSAGRPDFTLEQALSSHAAMHSAEGWLFRGAIIRAAEKIGLRVFGTRDAEVHVHVSQAAGLPLATMDWHLQELGRELGPPWRKDEKLATLAAWLALASDG